MILECSKPIKISEKWPNGFPRGNSETPQPRSARSAPRLSWKKDREQDEEENIQRIPSR